MMKLWCREKGLVYALHPEKIPARGARFIFTFGLGGITLLATLITVITGLLLMLYYDPTPQGAHASIVLINGVAFFGAVVRGLHYWGAQLMVIAATLHLARIVFTGAYRPPREDLSPLAAPISAQTPPEGRRLKEYYQPIAEFTKCEVELNCVDCHTAQEAMGNGHIYSTKKDSQYMQCQTCHGTPTEKPKVARIEQADELAMCQARINGSADFLHVGDLVIETARGEKLWSVKQVGGKLIQRAKVSGQLYDVPLVQGSACTQSGNDQSSQYCHQCHAVAR